MTRRSHVVRPEDLPPGLRRRVRARRLATTADSNAEHLATDAERERLIAAAEAANAAKTRYLEAVSHEIRSPLNAIYGYAQLLERDGATSPAEAGAVIRRSAQHLTNLVEGLLEISRIESGVLKVRSDTVHLPGLLDHVIDMFRMQAKAKQLDLRLSVSGRLPGFVKTDEKRLRQILINLVSNAIKYTSEGHVELAIVYRSQVAQIDIVDSGIGIGPEDLERVFEPFERGSSPAAVLQPGIGLGLAITRVLARILGGEITAMSTPGVGSVFRLNLFLPEPFTAPEPVANLGRITGYEGPRRTILSIDDDSAHTAILQTLLRRIGFVVDVAGNGAEGLALAQGRQPDLVLLDVQMPGIDGWEVADRLRAAYGRAMRIVMVSANAHEEAASATEPNHDSYIAKPVDQEALLAVIGHELKLHWQVTAAAPPQPPPEAGPAAPPKFPVAAAPFVDELGRLCRVGHIRGVETLLAELATRVPDSAPMVTVLREHVRNFDLASVMKLLDDAAAR